MNRPNPIASLPPLRDLIREAGLSAKKSLGQNFLLDLNIARRIAMAAGPLCNKVVIEIGPGPGGLTRALLLEGAETVIAIEKDERFRPLLAAIQDSSDGRLILRFLDALQADYSAIARQTGASRVIANLPYNIATPLIIKWLTDPQWPPWFDKLVVMVQREVAERLVAQPASKGYGRLSVLSQFRSRPRIVLTLPPTVFTPPPKVASALVEIVPAQAESSKPAIGSLEKITAAAFGQRRKMLRSSLSSLGLDTMRLLQDSDLDPTARAERLTVADFVRLARHFERHRDRCLHPRSAP